MTSLAILDLDYGNTLSVQLAFARLGVEATLVTWAEEVAAAERLVLPGVGAAGFAMARIAERGLAEPLRARTGPSLGICLGMQLLFESSDECDIPLLGILPGRVTAISPAPGFPVPHMGWSALHDVELGLGVGSGDHVYFAHGFACPDGEATVARAFYGDTNIPAALIAGPWWGAQFHPERSSAAGARFLEAFLAA